jgi:sigma-B regulation protein RsbU (phosphoserine phosphatase)
MKELVRLVSERSGSTQERLDYVVEMMREISRQTDPQAMVAAYRARIRELMPVDGFVSLARRGLSRPHYRITRSSRWGEDINPWRQADRLPLLEGGLLAELIYGDEPRIIPELNIPSEDPAAWYLEGAKSLVAIPNYDQGVALNMTVLYFHQPHGFDPELLPGYVWMSNLFGRATQSLVLARQLQEALEVVDRELKAVASIQRSLLPPQVPATERIQIATSYETSQWAGGDFFDFFKLSEGRLGILVADVSGHGTAAAVLMAITHALAHRQLQRADQPGRFLAGLNETLTQQYTAQQDAFVTAFYAVFDPADRSLRFANAGHPAPRLKRCSDGSLEILDRVGSLPLGIFPDVRYDEDLEYLVQGDQLVIYTDGITDASNPEGRFFGPAGLDDVLAHCGVDAISLLDELHDALDRFTGGGPLLDDQTIVIAKIT